MTNDKTTDLAIVLSLPVGAELDAWVERVVFGDDLRIEITNLDAIDIALSPETLGSLRRPARPFSTDGNAMLELMAAIPAYVWTLRKWAERTGHEGGIYPATCDACVLSPDCKPTYCLPIQNAETLPLAVCRAALAAVWENADYSARNNPPTNTTLEAVP